MSTNPNPDPLSTNPEASQHVAEARSLLLRMKESLANHPELDQAIERLEMALSILTTQTGGML